MEGLKHQDEKLSWSAVTRQIKPPFYKLQHRRLGGLNGCHLHSNMEVKYRYHKVFKDLYFVFSSNRTVVNTLEIQCRLMLSEASLLVAVREIQ